MTAEPMVPLPNGFVIEGRYEVTGYLGSGGQGDVYRVHDHFTNQDSALKLLKPTLEVWHEAKVLVHVAGQYLLPVRNADIASGVAYVVTEIATHGTAQDRLAAGVGVPTATAVRWIRHASRGVSRLIDKGLLHNDIKPANLFLDDREDVVLGDVGFATSLDVTGHAECHGGTPATTPPEVASFALAAMAGQPVSDRPCTVRSDVYGLAATAYWLLAGIPPYAGHSMDDVLSAVLAGPPRDLHDIAPHIPPGVRDVIRKGMAPDPNDRFTSPSELDNALGRLPTPERTWTRVVAHEGHDVCFEGMKGTSHLDVCAVPTGVRQKRQIQVTHHGTGRRVSAASWVSCTPAELPRRLRATFRQHG